MTIGDFISTTNGCQNVRVKTKNKDLIVGIVPEPNKYKWIPLFKIPVNKSYEIRYCLPRSTYQRYYKSANKVCFLILKFVSTPVKKREIGSYYNSREPKTVDKYQISKAEKALDNTLEKDVNQFVDRISGGSSNEH